MKLDELHRKFSRDATYRRAYGALGDSVAIAAHCRAIREEEGIRQADLAETLGVSKFYLARFENFGPAPKEIVAAVVRHFESQLRRRGVDVDRWLAMARPAPPPVGPPAQPSRDDLGSVVLPDPASTRLPHGRVSGEAAKSA